MTFALTSEITCLARETNRGVANTKVARANLSLIAFSVKSPYAHLAFQSITGNATRYGVTRFLVITVEFQ